MQPSIPEPKQPWIQAQARRGLAVGEASSRARRASMTSAAAVLVTTPATMIMGSSTRATPMTAMMTPRPTMAMTVDSARMTAASPTYERSHHHDFSAHFDPLVKVDDVLVAHADATRGGLRPDRPRLVGAVDAIKRRAEVKGARAQRILRAPRHVARQVGPAPEHLLGRRPIRPFPLLRDV